jgi:hypothetical protein
MNNESFRDLILNQAEYARQYRSKKKKEHLIKTIKNSKYKSKGNRSLNEIREALAKLGVLYEIQTVENTAENVVDETITLN